MVNIELFRGSKRIPLIREFFEISIDGVITDDSDSVITLDTFNERTNYQIGDIAVLIAVTYQKFNWPPIYWKYLIPLQTIEGCITPESIVLGVSNPVESLEYPGYYMIPYFSNYIIDEKGRLIRRLGNLEIMASKGILGYYTFRMMDDSGKTQNVLRHRILCYAFYPYPANVEELDVNHKNCTPGDDRLDNLEWVTRSENIEHALINGLRFDNKRVEVRDINSGDVFFFYSYSSAARALGCSEATIGNRARTLGYKAYDGMQFRPHPCQDPWPEFEAIGGRYLIEFPDKRTKQCSCAEAARLVGLTRTSLLRALREGRNYGTTENKVTRL